MNAAALSPEHLRAKIAGRPAGPGPLVDDLRRQSARPAAAMPDPLAAPGGPAEDQDWQDRQRERRQQLKVLLAGSKLHAGLLTAALGQTAATPGAGSAPDATDVAERVTRYVDRATAWIEATVRALEQRWLPADEAPPGTTPALSDYHRYQLARTLVATLRQRPECVEDVEPDQMATWLAAPARTLPPEPDAPPWVSAGNEADLRLAWSHVLARVLETAVDTPFNRPLDGVLEDARAAIAGAIAGAIERQTQTRFGALELPPEARRIVELHALGIAGQLYAATLRHVYHESTREIERYRDLLRQGREEEADRLAQLYQERRLGYVGIPHYFQEITAVHERQQEAALTAISKVNAVAATAHHP